MSLVQNIMDDIEESEISDNEQETTIIHEREFENERVQPRSQLERQQELEEKPEKEIIEIKNDKIDLKQMALLIGAIVMAYILIIQYKLADVFLEKYVENVPLIVKRFVLFSTTVSIVFFFST